MSLFRWFRSFLRFRFGRLGGFATFGDFVSLFRFFNTCPRGRGSFQPLDILSCMRELRHRATITPRSFLTPESAGQPRLWKTPHSCTRTRVRSWKLYRKIAKHLAIFDTSANANNDHCTRCTMHEPQACGCACL